MSPQHDVTTSRGTCLWLEEHSLQKTQSKRPKITGIGRVSADFAVVERSSIGFPQLCRELHRSSLIRSPRRGTFRRELRGTVMTKYDSLEDYMQLLRGDTWVARFSDLEGILGGRLPPDARRCAAWWSHDLTHCLVQAWRRAGWQVKDVDLAGRFVTFCRFPSHV